MTRTITKAIDELQIDTFEKPEHAARHANQLCEEFIKLGWDIDAVKISRGGVRDKLPWILNVRAVKSVDVEVPS